jgi:hypothetical protein
MGAFGDGYLLKLIELVSFGGGAGLIGSRLFLDGHGWYRTMIPGEEG